MKEMEVQFKPGYGLLAHNESIDGIADILKCFLREDEQLLFSFYERNIDFIHESDKDFILKRQIFTNSNWVLPWEESIPHWDGPNNTPPKLIWFYANEKQDIKKAIGIDFLFRCVTLKKGNRFEQYSNVLFQEEYYVTVDETEEYDHCIGFTEKKDDFLTKTLPILRSNISAKIDVLHS